jgi:hypothetical protein
MVDVREAAESVYNDSTRGEWQNREMFDALEGAEKVLADNLLATYDEVGPFDETDDIWVSFKSESENEDSAIGVRCENCVFFAAENACQILAVEIEPGGICRFSVIPPGYVEG